MTSKPRTYTEEFKQDAINLVVQKNYSVKEAAEALGMPAKTLQNWLTKYRTSPDGVAHVSQQEELEQENRRLKLELKQAQMERDLLKKRRHSLQRSRSEVCLYPRASRLVPHCFHLPGVGCVL